MIDFSIIIPVYNLEHYIVKTLESICQNNLNNTEIIVIDDGSNDKTKIMAEQYLEQMKVPQYFVLSQENKGVSSARNAGIDKAVGKYIIFCDGDDLCSADMISSLNDVKGANHDMIVWRYYVLQDNKLQVSQKEFSQSILYNNIALKSFLLKGNRIRLGSFAVKKSLLEEESIYFTEGCAIAEDIEFIYKCLAKSQTVFTMNRVLFSYVKRQGSAMNVFDLRRFQAPAAMQRVYQYVQNNAAILEDVELDNYIRNGLYILHSIFSFDASIQHLNNWKDAFLFLNIYFSDYMENELEIKRALKEMQIKPPIISKKKMLLFCLSRRLYVYLYLFKAKKK